MNEGELESAAHLGHGVGDEAWAVIEIDDPHAAVVAEHGVEAAEEERRGLRRPDDDVKPESRGVVEEEEGHATAALRAGSEVFAVGEHEFHAVRIGEAAHVTVALPLRPAGRDLHAHERAVDGGAVDVAALLEEPSLLGATQELGDRGGLVRAALLGEELEERRLEHTRRGLRLAHAVLERGRAALLVLREPAIDTPDADAAEHARRRRVVHARDLCDRGGPVHAREQPRADEGDDLVADERLVRERNELTSGHGRQEYRDSRAQRKNRGRGRGLPPSRR